MMLTAEATQNVPMMDTTPRQIESKKSLPWAEITNKSHTEYAKKHYDS